MIETYNLEDCAALMKVVRFLHGLSLGEGTGDPGQARD